MIKFLRRNFVLQRVRDAREVLEDNLQRAPEPARKGLKRALEAQGKGRGKGRHVPGPRKDSPSQTNSGRDFVPPGLRP